MNKKPHPGLEREQKGNSNIRVSLVRSLYETRFEWGGNPGRDSRDPGIRNNLWSDFHGFCMWHICPAHGGVCFHSEKKDQQLIDQETWEKTRIFPVLNSDRKCSRVSRTFVRHRRWRNDSNSLCHGNPERRYMKIRYDLRSDFRCDAYA